VFPAYKKPFWYLVDTKHMRVVFDFKIEFYSKALMCAL
jgi:hypothetical protein